MQILRTDTGEKKARHSSIGHTGRYRPSSGRALLPLLLLAVAPLILTGCDVVNGLLGSRAPAPTVTAVPATPRPSGQTATPPSQTRTAPASVSQQEAEQVVRSWFDAIAAKDYTRAESLTTGNGTTKTRQLADGIQQQTQQRGVDLSLKIQRLDFTPAAQQGVTGGYATKASFDGQVVAGVGPLSMNVQSLQGDATFVVERVNGQLRISDIRDPNGLPMP